MEDFKKKAKKMMLQELSKEMRGMMGDNYKDGLKKVTVASDSEEGLEKGLEKAGDILEESEDMSEEGDMIEALSDDEESEMEEYEEEIEEDSEPMDKDAILEKIRMLQEQLETM